MKEKGGGGGERGRGPLLSTSVLSTSGHERGWKGDSPQYLFCAKLRSWEGLEEGGGGGGEGGSPQYLYPAKLLA